MNGDFDKIKKTHIFAEGNTSDDPTMVKGQKIVDVRRMTEEEMEREGWKGRMGKPTVLELESGDILFPSQDPEGNGPGAIFGYRPKERLGYRLSTE